MPPGVVLHKETHVRHTHNLCATDMFLLSVCIGPWTADSVCTGLSGVLSLQIINTAAASHLDALRQKKPDLWSAGLQECICIPGCICG